MSVKSIHIEDALKQKTAFQWVDVRSESEFQKAHIPGAVNIPLLTNEHRILIGTCYKQKGREEAVSLGLELVGPKMATLFKKFKDAEIEGKKLLFYCWRGGLRSQISSTIYAWSGQKPNLLFGGYKSFRNFIQSQFNIPLNLKIVSGRTGSGKTEILHLLQKNGAQMIDLEGLAFHKGSAFGGLGYPPQPSTEAYENSLGLEILQLDQTKTVYVENESRLIGQCFMPQDFWDQMQNAKIIEVQVDTITRVKRLMKEYAHFDIQLLLEKTMILRKKLGGQNINEAVGYLENGEFDKWIDKLLVYYDKTYQYSSENNKNRTVSLDFDWNNKENEIQKLLKLNV
jgi:tRNA 2-selenouridine synthase